MCKEIHANSDQLISIDGPIRTEQARTPIFGHYKVETFAFWCPDRLYYPSLRDDSAAIGKFGASLNVQKQKFPTCYQEPLYSLSSDKKKLVYNPKHAVAAGSLWNQLGVAAGTAEVGTPDASGQLLPVFRKKWSNQLLFSYLDIYLNYFVNPSAATFPLGKDDFNLVKEYPVEDLAHDVDLMHNIMIDGSFPPGASFKVFNPAVMNAFSSRSMLGVRSYKPDYTSAYFNMSAVDDVDQVTKIPVKSDSGESFVFVRDILSQFKSFGYNMLNTLSGGRFSDWVLANFGVTPPENLTKPMLVAMNQNFLTFDTVVSTAAGGGAGEQYLGQQASIGTGSISLPNFRFKAREHGYLMILYSLVPDVSYRQYSDYFFQNLGYSDIYKPSLDNLCYRPLTIADVCSTPTEYADLVTPVDIPSGSSKILPHLVKKGVPSPIIDTEDFSPDPETVAFGSIPAWEELTTALNRVQGCIASDVTQSDWCLIRDLVGNPDFYADVPESQGIYGFSPVPYVDVHSANKNFVNQDPFIDNFLASVTIVDKTRFGKSINNYPTNTL